MNKMPTKPIEIEADDLEVDDQVVTIYGVYEDYDIAITIPLEDIEAALLPYRMWDYYEPEE